MDIIRMDKDYFFRSDICIEYACCLRPRAGTGEGVVGKDRRSHGAISFP